MQAKGDSLAVSVFEITIQLDPENSWVKQDKATDYLLVHKQGHFNIGLLYMKEVLKKISATSFSKAHFQQEIKVIKDEILKKYKDMGIQYDEETDRSKNKEGQAKWNDFFSKELL